MKDLEEMQAHNVCLKMIKEEALLKEKPLLKHLLDNYINHFYAKIILFIE